jgi:hypothetical protein
MKQLISLSLIILVTVTSWSSCAKNTVINVATMYSLTYPIAHYLLSTPTLTTRETTNSLNFPQAKAVNEHNRFFEFSIIFNESLQQMISFFTRSDDEKNYTVNNSFPSFSTNRPTVKACKENS